MFAFVKKEPEGAINWGLQLPSTFKCPPPETMVTVLLATSRLDEDVTNAGDFVFGMTGDRLVLVGEVMRMRTPASLQPIIDTLPPLVLTAVAARVMSYDLAVLEDMEHRDAYFYRGLRAALADKIAQNVERPGLKNVAWSMGYSGHCWEMLEALEALEALKTR